MIKVSVIMPVYNVEEYLEEALLSVMKQTLHEIEIICVNDGSTDGSLDILNKYANMDARIRVISKENSGYGHTMNVGIDAAQGEYIGVVETDDYVDANMFETLYEEAVSKQLDMLKAGYREFTKDKNGDNVFVHIPILPEKVKDLYGTVAGWQEDLRVFESGVVTWSGIYKRAFLNQYQIRHNETPGASYQDNGFGFQVLMYAGRVSFMDTAFYNLRRDNPNSSVHSKKKVFCMCDEYDFIRGKILEANHPKEKELLGICFARRLGNYEWSLRRIAPEYRPMFYERMRKDFADALELGECQSAFLTRSRWNYVYTVLQDDNIATMELSDMKEHVRERILQAEKIYIYGAGMWGKKVYQKLERNLWKDKIAGFLVTNKLNETDALFDIPVMQLDESRLEKTDLIIAAVGDRFLGEVLTTLTNKGCTNYIIKNDLF